jgi:hypothetical protein
MQQRVRPRMQRIEIILAQALNARSYAGDIESDAAPLPFVLGGTGVPWDAAAKETKRASRQPQR